MIEKYLSEGNSVKLKLIKKAGSLFKPDSEAPFFSSLISKILAEDEMLISVPRIGTRKAEMKKGDVYLAQFFTASGYFQGNIEVIGQEKNDIGTYAKMKVVSKLERFQRREYYRMECVQQILYTGVSESQKKIYSDYLHSQTDFRKRLVSLQMGLEDISFKTGTMLDISGGGLRFNSADVFSVGDYLVIQPVDEQLRNIQKFFIGEVVAKRYIGKQQLPYENKVKFINITAGEREKIVGYIFSTERMKRRTKA